MPQAPAMSSIISDLYASASAFLIDNAGVCIGVTVALAAIVATQLSVGRASSGDGFLTDTYNAVPLVEKTVLSHNTRLFRFGLPTSSVRLGLPLGRHVSVRAVIGGEEKRRPYTPTSSDSETGYFDLLIKVYPAPGGLMSRHMDALEIGETIDVRGPMGKFTYEKGTYKKFGMVAGGTGITPCWQVFREILADPEDTTEISLIFANVTEDDILLRDELDELAATESRFSVYYVLNETPAGWSGGEGYVTAEMIAEQIGSPSPDICYCHCGPPPMNKAVKAHLATLGVKDSNIFKF